MRAIPPQVFLSEISLPSITPSVEATGARAKFFHPENDKGAICDLSHQNLAIFVGPLVHTFFFIRCAQCTILAQFGSFSLH